MQIKKQENYLFHSGIRLRKAREFLGYTRRVFVEKVQTYFQTEENQKTKGESFPSLDTCKIWEKKGIPPKNIYTIAVFFGVTNHVFIDERLNEKQFLAILEMPEMAPTILEQLSQPTYIMQIKKEDRLRQEFGQDKALQEVLECTQNFHYDLLEEIAIILTNVLTSYLIEERGFSLFDFEFLESKLPSKYRGNIIDGVTRRQVAYNFFREHAKRSPSAFCYILFLLEEQENFDSATIIRKKLSEDHLQSYLQVVNHFMKSHSLS